MLRLLRHMLALRSSAWPLADQMLIAATSFATMILLARQLSVPEFGSFTLVYAFLYFANSMQSSLVTQPHNVLGATRRGEAYLRYTTSTAASQVVLAVTCGLMALIGWTVAAMLGVDASSLLLAAAPATVAWQLQEFVRRVLYTEARIGAAFVSDLVGYGGQLCGTVLLSRQGALTGPGILYLIAISSGLASLLGLWQLRHSVCRRASLRDVRENWHFGKWIAGGAIIGEWLSAQLLVFIAAAAIGPAAAGVMRAVHTLFGPSRILAQMFSVTLPTRLARALAEHGVGAFRSQLRQVSAGAIPLLGGYCAIAAVFAEPLLVLVFGDKYRGYQGVLILYAVSAFLTYLCILGTAVLRARQMTRPIFISEVIYLLVVPLGALLIPIWGIHGLVIGLIVGDVAALGVLWRAYVAAMRGRAVHDDEPAEVNDVLATPMTEPPLATGA